MKKILFGGNGIIKEYCKKKEIKEPSDEEIVKYAGVIIKEIVTNQ